MRKKRLVRLQLTLLVIVIGLLVWRSGTDADRPDGIIVFSDLQAGKLYRAGLQVDEETDLAISMTIAFETDEEDAQLAVYGWILDNRDHSVVWIVNPLTANRAGVLALVADTIHIAPGSYDVFFTTLGPTTRSRRDAPFLGLKPFWTNYKSEWSMSVSEAQIQENKTYSIREVGVNGGSAEAENHIWSTGPIGDHSMKSFVFRVVAPSDLILYSVGEMCTSGCDYGWIEDIHTSERIWQMDWENTEPAGGMDKNRQFSGTIRMAPGIYRAVFRTNGGHSANYWNANPPTDPDGWGLSMTGSNPMNFVEVDPWAQSQPIIDLTGIGDDEFREVQFALTEPASLIVFAVGEISSKGALYDYAWIENRTTHQTRWEMSREKSQHAGGDNTNRTETAFLDLDVGLYSLYYKSDESHSAERWRKSTPQHPERWGVTVFPMDPDGFDTASFSIVELNPEASESVTDHIAVEVDAGMTPSNQLVGFIAVENDADLTESFELTETTSLRIVAEGEISSGGRYDYGWIENAETGELVWEMTLKNTKFAGGEDRNRRFEGLLTLPAGSYVARYTSDFSHAFNDFGEGAPLSPRDWGMRIFRATP